MSGESTTAIVTGGELRLARQALGLSQVALARKLGVAPDTLARWERCELPIRNPTLVRLLLHKLGATRSARSPTQTRRPAAPRPALPRPPTVLVGRDRELAEVSAFLQRANVRLLTLVGPGGVGKTHLALAVAEGERGSFQHDAWFVDLSVLRDPTLVTATIAQKLGVRDLGRRSSLEGLQQYLHNRQLLLVLDNCEHVLVAIPDVAILLAGCSDVKVLATSREPLDVRGEQVFLVQPLVLPDRTRLRNLTTLAAAPAVALFVQRARAVEPAFELTADNADAVAEVCRRLDGLPLAIELAAARARGMPPPLMLARLGQPLDLLTGPRDAPDRHQSLRAAITWSYELLSPEEQALLRRLSAFAGGCSLEAAEAVCAPDMDLDVLKGLAALVEKNLLRHDVEPGNVHRFRLLETIRDFALDKFARSSEAEATLRRHAMYFLNLAERAEHWLAGPEQETWLDQLESEHDNLHAALQWSVEQGDVESGLRVGGALGLFWWGRGYVQEGLEALEQVLKHRAQVPAPARAKALHFAGFLAGVRGDQERSVAWLEECTAILRGTGDPLLLATSLTSLAQTAWIDGQYERAAGLLAEALAIARQHAARFHVVYALRVLAGVIRDQGDVERAAALAEEALALAPDRLNAALSALTLGMVVLDQGHPDRAADLCKQSLGVLGEGERPGAMLALLNLGRIAFLTADYQRAIRLLGAVESLRRSIGTALPRSERAHYEQTLAASRARVRSAEFAEAWVAGQAMSVQQAVAYALADGSTTAGPRASEKDAPDSLTRREREVAMLVARGYTNRQIAQELVVGERTAEAHVANSLGKLGLSSRTRLAAWAIEHGLGSARVG
jgi:predicted ATPase/DNA-binding CsgD family transcriptional regulator/transcriptional regulator with XRE-family HTH domain